MTNPVMVAVGRVAAASKHVNVKPGALEAARRDLQVVRLRRAIEAEISPEPPYVPLSDDDRVMLAHLLLGERFRIQRLHS